MQKGRSQEQPASPKPGALASAGRVLRYRRGVRRALFPAADPGGALCGVASGTVMTVKNSWENRVDKQDYPDLSLALLPPWPD